MGNYQFEQARWVQKNLQRWRLKRFNDLFCFQCAAEALLVACFFFSRSLKPKLNIFNCPKYLKQHPRWGSGVGCANLMLWSFLVGSNLEHRRSWKSNHLQLDPLKSFKHQKAKTDQGGFEPPDQVLTKSNDFARQCLLHWAAGPGVRPTFAISFPLSGDFTLNHCLAVGVGACDWPG